VVKTEPKSIFTVLVDAFAANEYLPAILKQTRSH